MHIGLAGPIATTDVAPLLDGAVRHLPPGIAGAPLLVTLIAELLRLGHEVSAYTLSNGMALDATQSVVARGRRFVLHYCPQRPKAWPPNGRLPGRIVDLYALERRGLRRAIESTRPDVVHAHWCYEYASAAVATGIPHVVTCHDAPYVIARYQRDFRHGAYRWLRAWMARQVLRRAERVTTVSPYMLAHIQPMCRATVRVVPNPVGAPAFAVPRQAQAGRCRIVMVANGWDQRKNSRGGLEAYALLHARLPAAELRVFGVEHGAGGPAETWWRRHGAAGNVQFLGPVSQARVFEEFSGADVFLHPALEESFGAVLAEAMAAGVPVVAGAHSGAVPWLVQCGGRLVDVRRPADVADALHALLVDRELAGRHGAAGRQRVADAFHASAVARRYETEYLSAIATQRRPATVTA